MVATVDMAEEIPILTRPEPVEGAHLLATATPVAIVIRRVLPVARVERVTSILAMAPRVTPAVTVEVMRAIRTLEQPLTLAVQVGQERSVEVQRLAATVMAVMAVQARVVQELVLQARLAQPARVDTARTPVDPMGRARLVLDAQPAQVEVATHQRVAEAQEVPPRDTTAAVPVRTIPSPPTRRRAATKPYKCDIG